MPTRAQDDDLVMKLVESALSHPPAEREGFLRLACGEDWELLREVWRYVQADERMQGFLLEPLINLTAPEHPFEPGQLLDNRFRIVREIAQGGMGVVYEAFDIKLDRRVALKCAKSGFQKRLPPEVRHASEISHPNVCKIFEIYTTVTPYGEIDFFTMEFLEGQTLTERLQGGPPIRQGEAQLVAQQLCAALAEAHRHRVIHGDLKANNVMLTKDPDGGSRAVIMDFGLARRPSSLEPGTAATGVGGAFDYMSPELLRGEMPSAASDIYALGVILHELAYGNRPMDALDLGRTDGAPRQHRHDWAPTIERCLDPDPASRFASACEVATALAPRPRRSLMAKVGLGVMGVVIAAALVYPRWFPKQDISSVAVLPFVNTSNTPESEFLADDLSEGLLNVLAQLPDLTVIARSSSSHFHKSNLGVREIARQLNVRALVTGRVAQLDQSLRINVELVDGASGKQVWGKSYDGEANNLGRLREAISRDIARQIRSNLTGDETSKLISQSASARPEAYELLLRGRYQVRLYAPDATRKAISLFEQAVVIDPQYAVAHAELANVYRRLGSAGVLNPQEALPMAEASARRALGLNKGLAEAHAVLADIKKDQWDWKAAEPEYRLALKLSPNLKSAREGLAIGLSVMGRHEEAIAETMRLRDLDPVGSSAVDLAATYYNVRRFDDALATLRLATDLDPASPSPWAWIGIVRGARGEFKLALEAIDKAVRLGDSSAATQCYYIFGLARTGSTAQARRILADLEKPGAMVPPSSLAIAYTGLRERERAFQLLERGVADRDPLMQYIGVEAHFDDLRNDDRFKNLADKIGIPR